MRRKNSEYAAIWLIIFTALCVQPSPTCGTPVSELMAKMCAVETSCVIRLEIVMEEESASVPQNL
ncbi:hypothetical protein KIN20_005947 [Parelaphostrongylus tenuis]|uniref:Uncharacterized protein n=1 Tax=Parelaphostrongylus tenuis TaxID=148309 RepID=A0AAD5MM93_PARTN|nr:hypothetical protein KIN20_005947 [Parelaphostrongylus tenuis]